MTNNLPRYTDTDGCTYEYEPSATLSGLRRYNIAQCARQRMQNAHHKGYHEPDSADYCAELWKRERMTFWSTLQHSIPQKFRVNR